MRPIELTMEAFGKLHTSQRSYGQWQQMEEKERRLHRNDMADMFIETAERFEHRLWTPEVRDRLAAIRADVDPEGRFEFGFGPAAASTGLGPNC